MVVRLPTVPFQFRRLPLSSGILVSCRDSVSPTEAFGTAVTRHMELRVRRSLGVPQDEGIDLVKYNVPHLDRDIFLDPDFRPETIRREFTRFINKVNTTGYAIAIAHPHPHTIQFIKQHLDELEEQGIRLVPVSELIANNHKTGEIRNVASTGTTGPGL